MSGLGSVLRTVEFLGQPPAHTRGAFLETESPSPAFPGSTLWATVVKSVGPDATPGFPSQVPVLAWALARCVTWPGDLISQPWFPPARKGGSCRAVGRAVEDAVCLHPPRRCREVAPRPWESQGAAGAPGSGRGGLLSLQEPLQSEDMQSPKKSQYGPAGTLQGGTSSSRA